MSELPGQYDSAGCPSWVWKYLISLVFNVFPSVFFLSSLRRFVEAFLLHLIRQNSLHNSCCADIWLKLLCAELEKSSLFQSILFSEKAETGMEMLIWGPPRRDTYILRNIWLSKSARALASTLLVLMLLNSLGKTKWVRKVRQEALLSPSLQ